MQVARYLVGRHGATGRGKSLSRKLPAECPLSCGAEDIRDPGVVSLRYQREHRL